MVNTVRVGVPFEHFIGVGAISERAVRGSGKKNFIQCKSIIWDNGSHLVLFGGVGACFPILLVFLLSCTTVLLVETMPCGVMASFPKFGLGCAAFFPPNVVNTGGVSSTGVSPGSGGPLPIDGVRADGGGTGEDEVRPGLPLDAEPVLGFLLGICGVGAPLFSCRSTSAK